MDQRIIAGLGNIYVCEALFRAGLDPVQAGRAPGDQDRQADARGRPAGAADQGGAARMPSAPAAPPCATTSRPTARIGAFQNEFSVYGREGEPCARPGCRGSVRRKTQGGRSTFYCPACQR